MIDGHLVRSEFSDRADAAILGRGYHYSMALQYGSRPACTKYSILHDALHTYMSTFVEVAVMTCQSRQLACCHTHSLFPSPTYGE